MIFYLDNARVCNICLCVCMTTRVDFTVYVSVLIIHFIYVFFKNYFINYTYVFAQFVLYVHVCNM